MTAEDGYFMAKRQIYDAIEYRLSVYDNDFTEAILNGDTNRAHIAQIKKEELKAVRNFIRNSMLWDITNDKND